ncbi:hypothetical protein Avbf_06889 [Armadillidium vulgare]|nr:hypothetical protein Avbf_06889 [Armadillidium vulgare]
MQNCEARSLTMQL